MDEQGNASYIRLAGAPTLDRVIDLGEVTLDDLLAAMREVLAIKPPAPSVNGAVPPITITIAQQMDLIERRRARDVRQLSAVAGKATSRMEVIVTLLALLEMVKQLRVTMRKTASLARF